MSDEIKAGGMEGATPPAPNDAKADTWIIGDLETPMGGAADAAPAEPADEARAEPFASAVPVEPGPRTLPETPETPSAKSLAEALSEAEPDGEPAIPWRERSLLSVIERLSEASAASARASASSSQALAEANQALAAANRALAEAGARNGELVAAVVRSAEVVLALSGTCLPKPAATGAREPGEKDDAQAATNAATLHGVDPGTAKGRVLAKFLEERGSFIPNATLEPLAAPRRLADVIRDLRQAGFAITSLHAHLGLKSGAPYPEGEVPSCRLEMTPADKPAAGRVRNKPRAAKPRRAVGKRGGAGWRADLPREERSWAPIIEDVLAALRRRAEEGANHGIVSLDELCAVVEPHLKGIPTGIKRVVPNIIERARKLGHRIQSARQARMADRARGIEIPEGLNGYRLGAAA